MNAGDFKSKYLLMSEEERSAPLKDYPDLNYEVLYKTLVHNEEVIKDAQFQIDIILFHVSQ